MLEGDASVNTIAQQIAYLLNEKDEITRPLEEARETQRRKADKKARAARARREDEKTDRLLRDLQLIEAAKEGPQAIAAMRERHAEDDRAQIRRQQDSAPAVEIEERRRKERQEARAKTIALLEKRLEVNEEQQTYAECALRLAKMKEKGVKAIQQTVTSWREALESQMRAATQDEVNAIVATGAGRREGLTGLYNQFESESDARYQEGKQELDRAAHRSVGPRANRLGSPLAGHQALENPDECSDGDDIPIREVRRHYKRQATGNGMFAGACVVAQDRPSSRNGRKESKRLQRLQKIRSACNWLDDAKIPFLYGGGHMNHDRSISVVKGGWTKSREMENENPVRNALLHVV